MSEYTVSFHHGEVVNQAHNRRDKDTVERANERDRENGLDEHIDVKGEHETWIDMTPEEGCHKILDQAVENYNEKQKRKDRKTTVEDEVNKYLRISKTGMTREVILTVGNAKDHPDDQECRRILRQEYQQFKRKNPNLQIIGVYYHADEPGSAPHLHIDYIPWHSKRQRGLDKQIGLKGALEDMGYSNKGFSSKEDRAEGALKRWTEDMRLLCQEVVRDYGFEIKTNPDKKKKHENTTKHKIEESKKEVEILEQQKRKLTREISELKYQAESYREERDKANDELQTARHDFQTSCVEYKKKEDITYKKSLGGKGYVVPEEDILFYMNLSSETKQYERLKNYFEENEKPLIKKCTRLERENDRLKGDLSAREIDYERKERSFVEDTAKGLGMTPEEVRKAFQRGRYDKFTEQNPWADIEMTIPKSGKLTDKQKNWIEKMLEKQLDDGKAEHNWMVVASREVGRENYLKRMKKEIIRGIESRADTCAEPLDRLYSRSSAKISARFYGNGNIFSTLWNLQKQVEMEADYGR